MMHTPYASEEELGLSWYMSDTLGIGGMLRSHPEDFHVTEIAEHHYTDGKYLICKLEKRNWDQQRAVKEIAKRLRISTKRIGFSGTKDKTAVTTQYISIYGVTPEEINTLSIRDMRLEPCGYMQRPLSLGQLQGNHFKITVRDLTNLDNLSIPIHAISEVVKAGIPNYFGIQRFGVKRPITHKVGLEILKQDYEQAVAVFVGEASVHEPEETQSARREYYESRDPKRALRDLPLQLSLERSILYHLEKHPDEHIHALCVLQKTLRSMFVGAVQSWFFNLTLSARLSDGRGLMPDVGDRVLLTDGRCDVVSERTRTTVMMQMKRGRIEPALMMPGATQVSIEGKDDEIMQKLMETHEIDATSYHKASQDLGMRFDGAARSILLKTDVEAQYLDEEAETFSFSLGPGRYATTVLREYMKVDPLQMA
ncbi:MAG: tRNA pseudouridine(13) synthase TruD [Methanomicrobiales archaeon]|jgi:tRNA pseudouridine13 synthase|nr:tRNA pseudouridine(13) synthase TruD [Methanomicrobiales archaeon]